MRKLPKQLFADRLIIELATMDDLDALSNIASTWTNRRLVDPTLDDHFVEVYLNEGDLPPVEGASKDYFYFYKATKYAESTIVGFVCMYLGYPDQESIWIRLCLVNQEHKQQGYGREIVEAILKGAHDSEAKWIAIGVDAKNYEALHFWTKCGFKEIVGTYGESTFSLQEPFTIALKRKI